MTTTIQFDSSASLARNGVALVYDLEGFSRFFNQPDVQDYVPRFLNHVSQALSTVIYGGAQHWLESPKTIEPLRLAPLHEKFLGDGALYIWTMSAEETTGFLITLCNRLWNLKRNFQAVVRRAADDVPVLDIPQKIRFGLARGTIFELTRKGSPDKEYIGFCINLAARLQSYCSDLGFIASARLGISAESFHKNGYIKVVATQIKGFPKELVFVDANEFAALETSTREELFEAL
jgi:class 3 adenylate cyclase